GKGAEVATPAFTLQNSVYSGVASASVSTTVLGVANIKTIPIGAHASATRANLSNGPCLVAIDTGAPISHVAITFNGAPNINLDGCTIRSNTSMAFHGHRTAGSAPEAGGSAAGGVTPTT